MMNPEGVTENVLKSAAGTVKKKRKDVHEGGFQLFCM